MAADLEGTGDSRRLIADVMGTTVIGMLLVAFVDDELHWHEHQTLVESVHAMSAQISAEDVLEFLDSSAHTLENIPRSQWPGLFETGRGLPEGPKVTVLAMCTKLAFADGHLTIEESDLIHQIADWLEVDQQGRKLWKEGVHAAIEAAQLRGFKYSGIENLERQDEVQAEPEVGFVSPHELASRAYVDGDFKSCVSLLHAGAAEGDPQCQTLLGTLYQDGDAGLEPDLARAVQLFEQAVAQHNLLGTFLLARTHYLGIGVTKDAELGLRLFKRSALMNFPDAQATLAEIYTQLRNFKLGGAWLVVAASNGNKEAMRYMEEQGDPPDEVKQLASRFIEAIHALQLIAKMNPELALSKLAELEQD